MESSVENQKASLKKLILAQVVLVVIGLVAFVYVSIKVSEELYELKDLTRQKEVVKQQYEELKRNIEQLYSVKVTPENFVYELKAMGRSTGRINSAGKATYNFTIYINAPEESLEQIEKVHYFFDHSTFGNQHVDIYDKDSDFSITWLGWGCLFRLPVTVHLKSGLQETIEFDMCKSLGWNVERKSKEL